MTKERMNELFDDYAIDQLVIEVNAHGSGNNYFLNNEGHCCTIDADQLNSGDELYELLHYFGHSDEEIENSTFDLELCSYNFYDLKVDEIARAINYLKSIGKKFYDLNLDEIQILKILSDKKTNWFFDEVLEEIFKWRLYDECEADWDYDELLTLSYDHIIYNGFHILHLFKVER